MKTSTSTKRLGAIFAAYNLAPFLALAVLLLVSFLFSPDFRHPDNLLNICRQVSFSGIIALGMTLVIAGGGIDLSVGSLLAFSGVLGLFAMNACPASMPAGLAFLVMVLVTLGVGGLGGAVNGALVNWGRIPPFIVTLGTFSIFRSLTVYFADAGLVVATDPARRAVLESVTRCWGKTVPVILLFLFAFLLFGVLRYTRFGMRLCATGANEKASVFAAVNVRLVRFTSYVIVGVLSGVGSILLASRLTSLSSPSAGNAYELDAIATVIIGGTPMTGGRASVWGTLAGIFILGIISNILNLWSVSANLQGTIKGLIIILAVLFQYKKGTVRS